MSKYLVGFDRFIALDWANYTFDLASRPDDSKSKISTLKNWLPIKVSGKDAARKTANVLTRLWLEPNIEADLLRNKAYQLGFETRKSDLVYFHWGMALFVFPFFRETCIQIGRLAALQPSINRQAVLTRMAEKYSNQGTSPRSVDRIIQTLVDWEALRKSSRQEYTAVQYKSTDLPVKAWLLEVIIYSTPNKRLPLNDFYRLPELFPFGFNGEIRQLVDHSAQVKIERDGNNSEYLVWTK